MNEQVAYMIEVQNIDLGMEKIELDEKKNLKEITGIENAIYNKDDLVRQLEKEAKELEKSIKLNELNIASFDEKINKFSEVQKQIKTNKEFNAMQKSIKNNSELKSAEEDRLLTSMNQQDEFSVQIKTAKEDIEKLSASLAEKKKRFEKEIIKNNKLKDDMIAKRTELIKNIKDEYFNIYESIKKSKKLPAIISVNKSGTCTGCFRILPPQQLNELLSEKVFMQCPICNRIIYFKKDRIL